MNIKELNEMISAFLEVGGSYYNITIEGLNKVEISQVLKEIARSNRSQIVEELIDGNFKYTVVKPSKKFLNREGQYSGPISKKASKFLEDYNNYIEGIEELNKIFTLNEAATSWGINEGTVRKAIASGRFIGYRKAGRITLVTEREMKRVFGARSNGIISE